MGDDTTGPHLPQLDDDTRGPHFPQVDEDTTGPHLPSGVEVGASAFVPRPECIASAVLHTCLFKLSLMFSILVFLVLPRPL